jgi:hypothetical protein
MWVVTDPAAAEAPPITAPSIVPPSMSVVVSTEEASRDHARRVSNRASGSAVFGLDLVTWMLVVSTVAALTTVAVDISQRF